MGNNSLILHLCPSVIGIYKVYYDKWDKNRTRMMHTYGNRQRIDVRFAFDVEFPVLFFKPYVVRFPNKFPWSLIRFEGPRRV